MARPQLHPTDTMLDAARDLLLEDGSRSATIEAIASSSGAPTGSIYHRFGSRDALIARLWMRAVYRSQARSEEHTSELLSHSDLVCRLLLEKQKTNTTLPSAPKRLNTRQSTTTHTPTM